LLPKSCTIETITVSFIKSDEEDEEDDKDDLLLENILGEEFILPCSHPINYRRCY